MYFLLQWAESQSQCNRLKLTDLLVKPMQRITKYSLLLQAILRKTEEDKQRRALLEMVGVRMILLMNFFGGPKIVAMKWQ